MGGAERKSPLLRKRDEASWHQQNTFQQDHSTLLFIGFLIATLKSQVLKDLDGKGYSNSITFMTNLLPPPYPSLALQNILVKNLSNLAVIK